MKIYVLMTGDKLYSGYEGYEWSPVAATSSQEMAERWAESSHHRALEEFELNDLSSFLDEDGNFLPYSEEG